MIKNIISYFTKGLLFILPILIVLSLLRGAFLLITPFAIRGSYLLTALFLIALTILTGFLVSKSPTSYFKRRIISLINSYPTLVGIFTAIKRFITVLNFSKEIFENPVIIKRERGKEIKFGFVTVSDMEKFGLKNHSSVYLPNPFSFLGEVVIVPNKDIEPVQGDKQEIISFILSGGIGNKK